MNRFQLTHWLTAIGALILFIGYAFTGKLLLDRGYQSEEAGFFLQQAASVFDGRGAAALQDWLFTLPQLAFQLVLLFYPVAHDFSPVFVSALGTAALFALVVLLMHRSGANLYLLIPTILLFVLHPNMLTSAVGGTSGYLILMLTALLVWSLQSWFLRRNNISLSIIAISTGGLILSNVVFLPLAFLLVPGLALYQILTEDRQDLATDTIAASYTKDDLRRPTDWLVAPLSRDFAFWSHSLAKVGIILLIPAAGITGLLLNNQALELRDRQQSTQTGVTENLMSFSVLGSEANASNDSLNTYNIEHLQTEGGSSAKSELEFESAVLDEINRSESDPESGLPTIDSVSTEALTDSEISLEHEPEKGTSIATGTNLFSTNRLLATLPFGVLLMVFGYRSPKMLAAAVSPVAALAIGQYAYGVDISNAHPVLMSALITAITLPRFKNRHKNSHLAGGLLIAMLLSAWTAYQPGSDSDATELQHIRTAFMFESGKSDATAGSTSRQNFRNGEHQSQGTTGESDGITTSGRIRIQSGDNNPPANDTPVTSAITSVNRTDEPESQEAVGQESTPAPTRLTQLAIANTSEVSRPTTDTSPALSSSPVPINWNDDDRYYFEVRITTNTGAAARRNYQELTNRYGKQAVTIRPEYRDGIRVRWLIGVGRYETFRSGVAEIERERGNADGAFIILQHHTDFRVFGDTPDFNPELEAFTILLASARNGNQLTQIQQAWADAGLTSTHIRSTDNGAYQLVTGRYNDEAEAEMLAEVIRMKSGQVVGVIAL